MGRPPKSQLDAVGKVFNRLLVVAVEGRNSRSQLLVKCVCACGAEINARYAHFKSGSIKSCGCLMRELGAARQRTHGQSESRTYRAWAAMKNRCYNASNPAYKDWGGRGIKVCERWLGSFENFYEDMGERPPRMSLDRRESSGNYAPDNCRWATSKQQANNRRGNVNLTLEDRTQTVAAWAEELGIKGATLYKRLDRGWAGEEVLTTKIKGDCSVAEKIQTTDGRGACP
jgi:hypothetical protein